MCEEQKHPCEKCNGRGQVTFGYTYTRTGVCFKCNGKGYFKTSSQHRAKQREQRKARQEEASDTNWEIFEACEPEVAEFINKNYENNSFLSSLREQARKRGDLSPKQIEAVHKNIDRQKSWEQKCEKPAGYEVDLTAVFEKFAAAQASGLKRPKLRLENFCFSLATGGKNAGAIYVKDGPQYEDTYLGKIFNDGVFFKSRECTNEQVEELQAISKNVLEAAVAYGRKTGNCSCCGRLLTNKESIELGIGPICLSKWGMQ
jgi:hypothetical protein